MIDIETLNMETYKSALEERAARDDLLVMVVEDQKFSRVMLKNFLAKHYAVITVEDGKSALAEYIQHAPDMVFLDIDLPDVLGHKVLQLITKLDPDAYIVMVTANNYEKDVNLAKQYGAKSFIVKPFTKDKIYSCIDEYTELQFSKME